MLLQHGLNVITTSIVDGDDECHEYRYCEPRSPRCIGCERPVAALPLDVLRRHHLAWRGSYRLGSSKATCGEGQLERMHELGGTSTLQATLLPNSCPFGAFERSAAVVRTWTALSALGAARLRPTFACCPQPWPLPAHRCHRPSMGGATGLTSRHISHIFGAPFESCFVPMTSKPCRR